MKGQVALVNVVINLKVADHYMASFIGDSPPNSLGARLFKRYREKVAWVLTDILTINQLPQEVRDDIRREINSDVLVMPSLLEKISLLNEESRLALEGVVDSILKGDSLTVETVKHEKISSEV